MSNPTLAPLQQEIDRAFLEAQKAKDALRVSTFRMLRAELKNREIEHREKPITDEEIIQVIQTQIKKRKEAIELYSKGGRKDLADKETKEMEILSSFLPKQLSEAELQAIVTKVIQTLGASGPKDLGAVMKAVMAEAKGKADGKAINQMVKKQLGA